MKLNKLLIAIIATSLLATSCKKFKDDLPSIANIAVSNPDFSELEAAAVLGGVAVVLSNKNAGDPSGKFTVFAPNNFAFARLGLVAEADLGVLNQTFLTNTLLFHVSNGATPGTALTGAAVGGGSALAGLTRRIITKGTDKYINGSKILATDVAASNGTVHVIDKVMLATGADILNSALALKNAGVFKSPECTFLVEAVLYANLTTPLTFASGNKLTVFAPTDAAFKQLLTLLAVPKTGADYVPADVRKLPMATVSKVLLDHVIADGGKFTPESVTGNVIPLGSTTPLTYGAFTNGTFTVKGAGNTVPCNMVIPDIQCTNGVVHLIDRVILN